MSKAWILFCLVCIAGIGIGWVPDRNLLVQGNVVTIAEAEVGVREATNRNDGVRVGEYQHAAGCRKGDAWCTCFVVWVFKQAGYRMPKTGWSPDLFPASRVVKTPVAGCVMGIYFTAKRRIAHSGIVTLVHNEKIYTIEGNTNLNGSAEGDGVYKRVRHLKTIKSFAEWR
ncbi:CHAP domain-containing protein [Pedobacter sp. MC2016-14]|uniref:CHAP domain-containing protein n=1 Tax=Pedobacter sp. MC2016-14 TaxID=2897327 RepID=UPI001E47FCCD|nr:CHAP domain-containing protein [Pedobacter sp. MC2016-14]MCD0487910.1 CHAP domain-containing protein [Pedobacter sp. MC2016-14]